MPRKTHRISLGETLLHYNTLELHYKNQNTLQRIAAHDRTFQRITRHHSALQDITVHYKASQRITVHYTTLQCITARITGHSSSLQGIAASLQCITAHYSTFQGIPVHYKTSQHITRHPECPKRLQGCSSGGLRSHVPAVVSGQLTSHMHTHAHAATNDCSLFPQCRKPASSASQCST